MKKNILFLLFTLSVNTAFSQVSITQFTDQVKVKNFTILEQAQKVYQAKESIQVARGELLPSLNVWKIIKVATNPLDVSNWIEIAPFLAPGNWYKFDQSKIYYLAERESYKAMAANQVINARILFIEVEQDQRIYKMIKDYKSELQNLYDIAKTKVDFGLEKPETAREIQIRILSLEEDLVRMKNYLNDVRRELSILTGGQGDIELILKDLEKPEMSSKNKLAYESLIDEVLKRSPEVKQYTEFLRIIPSIKKEIGFSFLGLTPASKGTSGGFFDQIPIPSGLGFGTAPSMNIANSQKTVLEIQRQAIIETLRKQTKSASEKMGSEIDLRPLILQKKSLASDNVNDLMDRIKLGENINLLLVADAFHTKRLSDTAVTESEVQFRMQREKIDRLLLAGDYLFQ